MIEPLVSVQIQAQNGAFVPGDTITCDYQIDAVGADDLQAVEAAILWYTEGKGDEDIGIHFFERRVPADAEENDLRSWRRIQTVLPNSPLSYEGEIIQIRWCFRVRAFTKYGKSYSSELPFLLGEVLPCTARTD